MSKPAASIDAQLGKWFRRMALVARKGWRVERRHFYNCAAWYRDAATPDQYWIEDLRFLGWIKVTSRDADRIGFTLESGGVGFVRIEAVDE